MCVCVCAVCVCVAYTTAGKHNTYIGYTAWYIAGIRVMCDVCRCMELRILEPCHRLFTFTLEHKLNTYTKRLYCLILFFRVLRYRDVNILYYISVE